MKCVGVCGNFGLGKNISNGQIIKTKIVTQELKNYFGNEQIIILDTCEWKKNPFKILLGCLRLIKSCRNVLILPAQNGIKVFAPLFVELNRIYKRKIHYSVIGGWLPELLSNNKKLLENIREIDTVYVETNSMKDKLYRLGLENVVYMPNFKHIEVIPESELPTQYSEPYKLCTFSRIKKEKGILDAIKAVKVANKIIGKSAFWLDIYGTIEPQFKNQFKEFISNSTDCVEYKGLVPFEQSTKVLKQYFTLLFPTYYEGEGFPGTIIDAFSSGLPVIATDWRYNSELIDVGKTGWIYELNESEKEKGLIETLLNIYSNPKEVVLMKKNCHKEVLKYDASIIMQEMISRIG